MLVISRKTNEWVRVGDEVVIRIINSKPGKTWLGFEAPREVSIVRGELLKHESDQQRPSGPQGER